MRCAHCPLGDRPVCRGEHLHPRDCELVDPSHPDYRPEWAGVLKGEPVVAPIAVVLADPYLYARIELCDFRHSECGCLSKPALCRLGGYAAEVALADCIQCVSVDIGTAHELS